MVSVLLTRPRASSEILALELKRHGYESVIEPLLIIEATTAPRPDISGVGVVMITSGNALEAGEQGLAAFFDFPCFCVGPRTAAKISAAGFRDVRSAASDGIELARFINDKMRKETVILHIGGEDIDSSAQDELARLGYKVVVWPVYAARPVPELTEHTIALLQQRKLNAVLVFSVRTAETLKALLGENKLEACCKGLTAIGLSEAVTDVLKSLPWRRLAAASVPTEDSVIECLKQNAPVFRE